MVMGIAGRWLHPRRCGSCCPEPRLLNQAKWSRNKTAGKKSSSELMDEKTPMATRTPELLPARSSLRRDAAGCGLAGLFPRSCLCSNSGPLRIAPGSTTGWLFPFGRVAESQASLSILIHKMGMCNLLGLLQRSEKTHARRITSIQ